MTRPAAAPEVIIAMDAPEQDLLQTVKLRPDHLEVELYGILDLENRPLVVRVDKPDRLEMVRTMRALPGAPIPTPPDAAPEDAEQERFLAFVPGLIERFVSAKAPDGTWRRPAFSFAEEVPAGLLPGRELSFADLERLSLAIMTLGGYAGGAASQSFLDQRGRGAGGGGTVGPGEGQQ